MPAQLDLIRPAFGLNRAFGAYPCGTGVFVMEQKPRARSAAEKVAQVFSLPADAVAGMPLVELVGDAQLRVERHRGILAYDPTDIHIGGGRVTIRVRGLGLELKTMNRTELLITGRIASVELE